MMQPRTIKHLVQQFFQSVYKTNKSHNVVIISRHHLKLGVGWEYWARRNRWGFLLNVTMWTDIFPQAWDSWFLSVCHPVTLSWPGGASAGDVGHLHFSSAAAAAAPVHTFSQWICWRSHTGITCIIRCNTKIWWRVTNVRGDKSIACWNFCVRTLFINFHKKVDVLIQLK